MTIDIGQILGIMVEKRASDLHLVTPSPPVLRIRGILHPIESFPAVLSQDTASILGELTNQEQRLRFQSERELDFAYVHPGVGRFRVNACRQRGSISLVFRLINENAPLIKELRLPPVCQELALRPRGLILITGPTGSGKSTTLAAMVEYLNQNVARRVITIEDPIEFIYTNKNCVISQREVGEDTRSFAAALRHVLRQNPDVILVGEMRDGDTAAAALTAAETGHLVLTTGHAPSADQAIERVIDLFPPYQQTQIRSQLASVVEGVLCQVLVPLKETQGIVPAVEIMLANPAVRNLIREGKIFQLPNVIRTCSDTGMQTLDRALAELFRAGLISKKDALTRCRNPEELELLIRG
jgi:twitching motility protein PilT